MAKELAQRGWEIDTAKLAAPHDGAARVLPCPARRDTQAWVFDAVPLRTPA
jgi:hypothetical protein